MMVREGDKELENSGSSLNFVIAGRSEVIHNNDGLKLNLKDKK